MTKVDIVFYGLAGLWVGFLGLAYIVIRDFGWSRLKHRLVGLFLVVMSLAALPGAVALKIAWPHRFRVMALFIRNESPAIVLSNGCSMFPANNIWNARIFSLPVDPDSDRWVTQMGPERGLHADFAMPYNVVNDDIPVTTVEAEAAGESDAGPYRIPENAVIENGEDSHVLVLDTKHCMLYELYHGRRVDARHWQAGSAAIFDLKSNALRPEGWTSSDGAGLPLVPGLLRFDEVKSGHITHALRCSAPRTQRKFIWPARHYASSISSSDFPPMGARFRLKSGYDITGFSPDAQVILTALKEYGLIVSDNGGAWFMTGSTDTRWKRSLVKELAKVAGGDFEAVDSTRLMIDKDSAAAKQ